LTEGFEIGYEGAREAVRRAAVVAALRKVALPAAAVVAAACAFFFLLWLAWFSLAASLFSGPATRFKSGEPTTFALSDIGSYFPIFQQAQDRYGVSWAVLAAIAKIESGFGQGKEYLARGGVSPKGAVGFMQFMPTTWSGSGNPYAFDDPKNPRWDTDPERIARYGGYGTDADGDGVADPFNPWDAVFAAAKMLKENGFAEDPRRAIYSYNHSWAYVDRVLELAESYSKGFAPLVEGAWPLPPQYSVVTSPFGERVFGGRKEFHHGIDIACPEGTPVYAVLSGRVVRAEWGGAYGRYVMIDSEGGISTVYAHLSTISVRPFQYVQQGEVIGFSGNTGRSSGPHLHFEVRMGNRPCDPLAWLVPPTMNY